MAEEIGVDDDLHARLIAATKEGDGMATWAILQALDRRNTPAGKSHLNEEPVKEETPEKKPKAGMTGFAPSKRGTSIPKGADVISLDDSGSEKDFIPGGVSRRRKVEDDDTASGQEVMRTQKRPRTATPMPRPAGPRVPPAGSHSLADAPAPSGPSPRPSGPDPEAKVSMPPGPPADKAYLIRDHFTNASPSHDMDFESMAALNVSTWLDQPGEHFKESSVCPMCNHIRYELLRGDRRPRHPQRHVDPRSFAFHIIRPTQHREFQQWEKIALLGLIIRRCPGVWEKFYAGVEGYGARLRYELDLDMDKIVELMITEQRVRRDFLSWVNSVSNNLRADRIVLPSRHLSG